MILNIVYFKYKITFLYLSMIKSPLKWVGGKSKLSPYIIKELPEKFGNYFEPFAGGASILFKILNIEKNSNREYFISDINECLMHTFNTIKYNVELLITELKKDKYSNHKELFYLNRKRYNEIKFLDNDEYNIEKAALFIYLNKCCFNGMYRENSNGLFNVPFGDMKNPTICDCVGLRNVSKLIIDKNVHFSFNDYTNIIHILKEGDLVYLDPPYLGTFTEYTNNVFENEEQIKLRNFIDVLTSKNVYVLLSNNDINFIKKLYDNEQYKFISLNTTYSLGGKNTNRHSTKNELLIKNF